VGVTPHQGERESRLQGQVAQVSTIIQRGKVRVMQRAEALMEIIHERNCHDGIHNGFSTRQGSRNMALESRVR
jgi:hypothetical protein